MSAFCATDSLLPVWVTVCFIGASFIILIFVSIYSMTILKRRLAAKWSSFSATKRLKLWAKDVWKRKAVYLPLVAHFSDTATDFAAVIEFYQIADVYGECNGLNMWYLFVLSIVCMALYRLISSLTIWRITHSMYRVILQLIDFELFEILYISHWLGLKAKSSPQRLISTLEAVFEASPQSIIQLIYLIKTQNPSTIVIISTVVSLISLSVTIISDDKQFLEIQFASPFKKNKRDWNNNLTKEAGCYKFGKFVCLHLFRIFNIMSQILFYVFVWLYVNGYALCGIIVLDTCIAVICYMKTQNTDALMSIIALPFSFGPDPDEENQYEDNQPQTALFAFWAYALLRTIALNIVIWIFIGMNGFGNQAFVTGLWLFCCFASIATWIFKVILHKVYDIDRYAGFSKERSGDIDKLIDAKLYADALDIMFYQNMNIGVHYKTQYNVDGYKISLLGLALKGDNIDLFQNILEKEGLENDQSCDETALMIAAKQKGKHAYIERIFSSAKNVDKEYVFKELKEANALRIAFKARNMEGFKFMLHTIFVEDKFNEMAYYDAGLWTIEDKDYSLLALLASQYVNGSAELFEAVLKQGLDTTHTKVVKVDTGSQDVNASETLMDQIKQGLDTKVDNAIKRNYWTAFGVCVQRCNDKFVAMLMDSKDMNMGYMMRTMYVGETLLSLAITNCKEDNYGESGERVLDLILSKINELFENDEDKVKWLNNAKPEKKQNALHVVCYQWLSVSIFQKLFEFYPQSYRKEALQAKDYDVGRNKNKNRSVLEYVNEKENNKYSSTAFDKRRIAFKSSTKSYINGQLRKL